MKYLGSLYSWGLSDGCTFQEVPTRVDTGALQFRDIACSPEFSVVVSNEGGLYSWGSGYGGQLGLGHVDNVVLPSPLDMDSERFVKVSCGMHHVLALTDTGIVYSWGENYENCVLGNSDLKMESKPKRVTFPEDVVIQNISCGSYHNLCLTKDGVLYVWGLGSDGRLGLGDEMSRNTPFKMNTSLLFTDISAGGAHSLAISNGRLYSWGRGLLGRTGLQSEADVYVPTVVQRFVDSTKNDFTDVAIAQISAGYMHSCVLSHEGIIFTFGRGKEGQLGHGHLNNLFVPTSIENFQASKISTGRYHTIALTLHGALLSWGSARNGCVGPSDTTIVKTPQMMHGIEKKEFMKITSSWNHNLCLIQDVPNRSRSISTATLRAVKIHFPTQTLMVKVLPNMNIQEALSACRNKVANFDIQKFIATDIQGKELDLSMDLNSLKVLEFYFKTPRPQDKFKSFVIWMPDDLKHSMIWKPDIVLRDVVSRVQRIRDGLEKYVPKNADGVDLDLDKTLLQLGLSEIWLNSKSNEKEIELEVNNQTYKVLASMSTPLSSSLSKIFEQDTSLDIGKITVFDSENNTVNIAKPIDPKMKRLFVRTLTPKALSTYTKYLEVAVALMKRLSSNLKQAMPKDSFQRLSDEEFNKIAIHYFDLIKTKLKSSFSLHEVIYGIDGLDSKPTWMFSFVGKSNFQRGIPYTAISITYFEDKLPCVSVLLDFVYNDVYHCEVGKGGQVNHYQLLQCSNHEDLNSATIAYYADPSVALSSQEILLKLLNSKVNILSTGSPELQVAMLSRGIIDASFMMGVQSEQVANMLLLGKESGVMMYDMDSLSEPTLESKNILASNAALVGKLYILLTEDSTPIRPVD